jgi:hypothetical protein
MDYLGVLVDHHTIRNDAVRIAIESDYVASLDTGLAHQLPFLIIY